VRAKEFYEAYWRQAQAPPQGDPTTAERKARLVATLKILTEKNHHDCLHVLDAGCGDGEFLEFLYGQGFRVAGMEISETAVGKARRRCPKADIRVGSLEEPMPFADAAFDALWCTEVLEHLFDVHAALTEFNRVLKRGGILLFTTPYHGFVKNLAIVLLNFDQHFNPDISHIRFFTRRTLERCLTQAGFTPLSWQGVGRIWPLWKSFFVVARKDRQPEPPQKIIG
jgi:SAM-dependent methyltransferase